MSMTTNEAVNVLNEMWETLFKEMRRSTFNELDSDGSLEEFTIAHSMAIKALDDSKWIPVSERLPKESDYRPCENAYWNDKGAVMWCTDKGLIGMGWYYDTTGAWANLEDVWRDDDGEVVAWKPLPEPYKEVSECSEENKGK